jgi:hypothetical protein
MIFLLFYYHSYPSSILLYLYVIFPIPLNIFSKSLILIFKVQLLSSFFLTLKFISHFPSTIYHHNSPNQSSIYFFYLPLLIVIAEVSFSFLPLLIVIIEVSFSFLPLLILIVIIVFFSFLHLLIVVFYFFLLILWLFNLLILELFFSFLLPLFFFIQLLSLL